MADFTVSTAVDDLMQAADKAGIRAAFATGTPDGTKFLRDDGAWTAVSGGSGDVVGPASATDNAIARFDGTTGKLIQNSGASISDTGSITCTDVRLSTFVWVYFGANAVYGWNGSGAALNNLPLFGVSYLQFGQSGGTATPSGKSVRGELASGSNISGGPLWLDGGYGTGTGNGGAVVARTTLPGSSGTTAHTNLSTRLFAAPKLVPLTNASATKFVTVSVGSSKTLGLKIVATVYANDGTDFQSLTSEILVDAVNKGGTITSPATPTQTHGTLAASAGTLTAAYTVTTTTGAIEVNCNANSSLAATIAVKFMIVACNSDDVATVTVA